MARLSPLEAAVLEALAWDLRASVPDLAGQVEESLPGQRRNTGAGYYAEIIVDRRRPSSFVGPTGLFGSVHAMIGDLPEPVSFKVELRQGRLLALHADTYGQDTRAIDFARVPFDEVFTVDASGESVLFEPAALMPQSPLRDLHAHPDAEPWPLPAAAPAPRESPLRTMQRFDEAPYGAPPATTVPASSPPSQNAMLVATLAGGALFALGLLTSVWFEFGLLTFIPLLIGGTLLRVPKAKAALALGIDAWLEAGRQRRSSEDPGAGR